MKRKYYGSHRSTIYKRIFRDKKSYYAVMEEPTHSSTSSVVNKSPVLEVLQRGPEVSTNVEPPEPNEDANKVGGKCLLSELREFCLKSKLSYSMTKDLLRLLLPYHPELIEDSWSLLETTRMCIRKPPNRNDYIHLGLENSIFDELFCHPVTSVPEMRVQLQIEKMKYFKDSAQCMWPIFARVIHPVVGKPCLVGLFCRLDPDTLDFLDDCANELEDILAHGLHDPHTQNLVKVNSASIICETPARSYVRQIKVRNGFDVCRHMEILAPNSMPAAQSLCCQQVQKEMVDVKVQLASLEKVNNCLAEQLLALNNNMKQVQATLTDLVITRDRNHVVANIEPWPPCLPLCTFEAYEDFIRQLGTEDGFADKAVKKLAVVSGRNEPDFIRNLLSALLGPPLCHDFCWAGGSKDKRSFIACPLFPILKDSIERNSRFSSCSIEAVRRTAINWFHGSKDRYGGRSKRRRTTHQVSSVPTDVPGCPPVSSPEDITPPVIIKNEPFP